MARRVRRCPDRLWRNIRFRVTWIKTKLVGAHVFDTRGTDDHDSAEYFPKASIKDILDGMKLWGLGEGYEYDVQFLSFEDFSSIWPQDGGHEWRRDSPMTTACPSDRATWYRCKHCKATAKRVGGPDKLIVRCTGEKVCPAWRREAQK